MEIIDCKRAVDSKSTANGPLVFVLSEQLSLRTDLRFVPFTDCIHSVNNTFTTSQVIRLLLSANINVHYLNHALEHNSAQIVYLFS